MMILRDIKKRAEPEKRHTILSSVGALLFVAAKMEKIVGALFEILIGFVLHVISHRRAGGAGHFGYFFLRNVIARKLLMGSETRIHKV